MSAAGPAGGDLAALFIAACHAELRAPKPGNVHDYAPGHRMTVADFETSAAVAAPHIAAHGAPIGERVLGAVRATMEAVGCNTNLGILLLTAPIALAAERPGELRANLTAILTETTIYDAECVFEAIRIANPGGLGRAEEADVAEPPSVTLTQAMALAADRDTIARQYVTRFDDVYAIGLPTFLRESARSDEIRATLLVYFAYASRLPDSHILRKHGVTVAEAVRGEFAELRGIADVMDLPALLDFDRELKMRGVNPGTSADLTVATHFLAHVTVYK
ncbi:triphosphoribosyl-dephospho-CoA synthase [Chthonobacter albigriseus]|uniref:triphosphoribosyl-dephospho-CoA synthase n=1 Tax=Chthonobacter albigriseus TaxID=1683161 RepID=UPI0015EEFF43